MESHFEFEHVTHTSETAPDMAASNSPVCQVCQRILDPESSPAMFEYYEAWPNIDSLRHSAENGCPLCQLFILQKSREVSDPVNDVARRSKKLMKPGSIYVAREASRPESWTIFEIQDGPSKVLGEVLVFEHGSLQFSPPLEPKPLPLTYQIVSSVHTERYAKNVPQDISRKALGSTPTAHRYHDVSGHIREKFQYWRQECARDHEYCKPSSSESYVPTRLLRVSGDYSKSGQSSLTATLCELGASSAVRYLALSYRWPDHCATNRGDTIPTLTTPTLETLRQGISTNRLLPTYQSALHLAQHLNYEYIWIDALCILQDSIDDWAMEAQVMHKVYQNADCTLSLDESNANHKFALERRRPLTPAFELCWTTTGTKRYIIPRPRYYQQAVGNSALAARGWVFQERIFSNRILHFTQNEIFWRCNSSSSSESGTHCISRGAGRGFPSDWIRSYLQNPKPQGGPRDELGGGYTFMYALWGHAVRDFTAKDLTFPSDRLPAMAGIAAAMSIILPDDEYIAGAWSGSLTRLLGWFVEARARAAETSKWVAGAPSWSWASVSAPISWLDNTGGRKEFQRPTWYLDHISELATKSPFGPLSSSRLKVKGRILPGKRRDCVDKTGFPQDMLDNYDFKQVYTAWILCYMISETEGNFVPAGKVFFDNCYHRENFEILMLTNDFVLAVERLHADDRDINEYRRIGILHARIDEVKPPDGYAFNVPFGSDCAKELEGTFPDIVPESVVYLL
jgi:hypothetical protein